ncbi:MAG: hypothetical protein HW386_2548 [Gammaproteobacteria bacterium]|nr:hypothetical protein [Gammaproteobacteria bacterium]
MIPITSLWLPILVSAILVFIASSVIHMVLKYHDKDWKKVPAEDEVMAALRKFQIPPGDYYMPRPDTTAQMNTPEFKAKRELGPKVTLTVYPPGETSMARNLLLWFLYSIVIAVFAGYVAGIVLPAGSPYLTVFRITSTVAFAGYTLAHWQNLIWYSRNLVTTLKTSIDGLVYALLTHLS